MIPIYYDLHIHSALSPCADDDMTPNDIVGMALLNGLDLIAITDHNSLLNAKSVMLAAKKAGAEHGKELIVLPGIEVSTAEEVHAICLFGCLESAEGFQTELSPFFSELANRADIFGHQLIYDENDCVTGELERMLIAPSSISFDNLYSLVHKYEGAFIPAHIDRDSFSVLSNLGFLPPQLGIGTLEVSLRGLENKFCESNPNLFEGKNTVFSSDAHRLWEINERVQYIMLPEYSAKAAIDYLC